MLENLGEEGLMGEPVLPEFAPVVPQGGVWRPRYEGKRRGRPANVAIGSEYQRRINLVFMLNSERSLDS